MMQTEAGTRYLVFDEKMKKPIPCGEEVEIDMIEEAGILVTVKPHTNLKSSAAVGFSSKCSGGPNGEMKPCGGSRNSTIVRLTNAILDRVLASKRRLEFQTYELEVMGLRCGKFKSVVIPVPNRNPNLTQPGVGKVFVLFKDSESAARFRAYMHGKRYFGEHVVVAEFFPEDTYARGDLDALV